MATRASSNTGRQLAALLAIWGSGVAAAAMLGLFRSIPGPGIAALVAAGVAFPTLLYFTVTAIRDFMAAFGLRALTLLHAWRIGAALLFFHYGAQGLLPDRFVLHAAWGDLIAGLAAVIVVALPFSRGRYLAMHLFGFADFLLAVGTGLYFTLVDPPAMDAIRELPLALIPLFGVGISGATHIIAFDLLRRGRGFPAT